MRKRVYICGPISKGDLAHNVNQATAAFVALARAGLAPLCPHWSVYAKPCERDYDFDRYQEPVFVTDRVLCTGTTNGNDEMGHADWIGVDLPWVAAADAVVRLPGESAGADLETACARDHGVPVYHSVAECIAALAAWVLPVQTAVLGRVIVLDPAPTAAGVYRITRDGDAEFVAPSDVRRGDVLFARHLCPDGPPAPEPAAPVCAYCGEPAAGHDHGVGESWLTCRDGSGRQVHLDTHFRPRPLATCGRCGAGVPVPTHDLGGEG